MHFRNLFVRIKKLSQVAKQCWAISSVKSSSENFWSVYRRLWLLSSCSTATSTSSSSDWDSTWTCTGSRVSSSWDLIKYENILSVYKNILSKYNLCLGVKFFIKRVSCLCKAVLERSLLSLESNCPLHFEQSPNKSYTFPDYVNSFEKTRHYSKQFYPAPILVWSCWLERGGGLFCHWYQDY